VKVTNSNTSTLPASQVVRQHDLKARARSSSRVMRPHASRARASAVPRAAGSGVPPARDQVRTAGHVNDRQTTLRALQSICLAMLQQRRHDDAGRPPPLEMAHRSLVELGAQLTELVGAEGYRALVSRALQLAATDFPKLAQVHPARDEPGRLSGLDKLSRRGARGTDLEALAATLGAVLWLLLGLIGEDLTQHVLDQAWPWIADSRHKLRTA
jgi:hypothetical protein